MTLETWKSKACDLISDEPREVQTALAQLLSACAGDSQQALAVLRLLRSLEQPLDELVELFLRLARACGSWAQAKLALSLLCHSQCSRTPSTADELELLLSRGDCVPAAIRLWETLQRAPGCDAERRSEALECAALLAGGGRRQAELLERMLEPDFPRAVVVHALTLARRLRRPGWLPEGSWGLVDEPGVGVVWSDGAKLENRVAFGMTLTSAPVSLSGTTRSQFKFRYRCDIKGLTDRCHLEVAGQNGKWVKLMKFDGEHPWSDAEVDLSAYDGQVVTLRFHVISGHDREGEGVALTGFRLEGVVPDTSLPVRWQPQSGWERRPLELGEQLAWVGTEADSPLVCEALDTGSVSLPMLKFRYRFKASSVYQSATLHGVSDAGERLQLLKIEASPKWRSAEVCLESLPSPLSFEFSSNILPRRDDDGLFLTDLKLIGSLGEPQRRHLDLDGSWHDGDLEANRIAELLREKQLQKLEHLNSLAQRLRSVRAALSLEAHIQNETDLEALAELYLAFEERAPEFYQQVVEACQPGEEHLALSRLLVVTGPEHFAAVRDILGEGVLPLSELSANQRLYLQLGDHWSPQDREEAFRRIMVPITEESLSDRRQAFARLLEQWPDSPTDVLKSWSLLNRNASEQGLSSCLDRFLILLSKHDKETAWQQFAERSVA